MKSPRRLFTKDRVLGLVLFALALSLNPSALGALLAHDGDIATRTSRFIIYSMEFLTGATGLALIGGWRLPSRLHHLLVLSLLFPLSLSIYANMLRPTRTNTEPAPDVQLQIALDQLSRSFLEKRSEILPDYLVAREVRVAGLASDPPELSDIGFDLSGASWPLGATQTLGRSDFDPLRPLFDEVGEMSYLDLQAGPIQFLEESRGLLELEVTMQGRAEVDWFWDGLCTTTWKRTQENNWCLTSWEMKHLELLQGRSVNFREVQFESGLDTLLKPNSYHRQLQGFLEQNKAPLNQAGMFLAVLRRPSLSVVDFDGDKRDDLFLVRRMGDSLLLHNQGDGKFEEIGEMAGLKLAGPLYSSLFLDSDNDGDPDLVLAGLSGVAYLENQNGVFRVRQTFTEVGEIGSMAVGDVDSDGLSDVVLASFGASPSEPGNVSVLINSGKEFRLTEIKLPSSDWFLSTHLTDIDEDGAPDLLLLSQLGELKVLRNSDGHFEMTQVITPRAPALGRGAALGDVNNDGRLELFVCRSEGGSELYRNQAGRFQPMGRFPEQPQAWPTGAQFVDLNGDGWLDLYTPTGCYTPPRLQPGNILGRPRAARQANKVFLNRKGSFVNATGTTGLESRADSRGFASLDFDGDGRVDLALVNSNTPFFQLFRKISDEKTAVKVRLLGGNKQATTSTWSNRDGWGARVLVEGEQWKHVQERRVGDGFGCQSSPTMVFHLPPEVKKARLTVFWPSGRVQESIVKPGQSLLLREEEAARP